MKAHVVGFGEIEVEGKRYDADVVIERGEVRGRHKKLSKPHRDRFGHAPLSAKESISWGGPHLIVAPGGRSPADHGGGLLRGRPPERRDRRAAH
jgi:hypothetical protein